MGCISIYYSLLVSLDPSIRRFASTQDERLFYYDAKVQPIRCDPHASGRNCCPWFLADFTPLHYKKCFHANTSASASNLPA